MELLFIISFLHPRNEMEEGCHRKANRTHRSSRRQCKTQNKNVSILAFISCSTVLEGGGECQRTENSVEINMSGFPCYRLEYIFNRRRKNCGAQKMPHNI